MSSLTERYDAQHAAFKKHRGIEVDEFLDQVDALQLGVDTFRLGRFTKAETFQLWLQCRKLPWSVRRLVGHSAR